MPDRPLPYALPPVELLDEVGSTNDEAHRRAAAGERGPIWIATRRQTAGKGRSGRAWVEASEGNVAATLLFAPNCPPARLPELSLVAGVATYDAVAEALTGSRAGRVELKWPNDVLIEGAKISGILIESGTYGGTLMSLIGIGINVASAPDVSDRAVTSLSARGSSLAAREVLDLLVAHTAHWLATWEAADGFAAIRAAWAARAIPLGRPLEIKTQDGPVAGAFAGLDDDGALLIDLPLAGRRRFTFGDVTVLPSERA
ncbi:biotin--[acetyl-CoA-carboxylase] ligase [Hyphomicrobium sp. CS1BSMeth3]|uniref:biotin--[acetyl-CoA-carboxylase] ligase n=1 Tax=Hyphomicrobium sp. CS1BSMeth3 TaxID=1892844 RepID=UPI000930855F|nr:biotin--[acetyl-CoA-carboxylase] ligase [Hyphomicrobium sp. CS1BSMeth3]